MFPSHDRGDSGIVVGPTTVAATQASNDIWGRTATNGINTNTSKLVWSNNYLCVQASSSTEDPKLFVVGVSTDYTATIGPVTEIAASTTLGFIRDGFNPVKLEGSAFALPIGGGKILAASVSTDFTIKTLTTSQIGAAVSNHPSALIVPETGSETDFIIINPMTSGAGLYYHYNGIQFTGLTVTSIGTTVELPFGQESPLGRNQARNMIFEDIGGGYFGYIGVARSEDAVIYEKVEVSNQIVSIASSVTLQTANATIDSGFPFTVNELISWSNTNFYKVNASTALFMTGGTNFNYYGVSAPHIYVIEIDGTVSFRKDLEQLDLAAETNWIHQMVSVTTGEFGILYENGDGETVFTQFMLNSDYTITPKRTDVVESNSTNFRVGWHQAAKIDTGKIWLGGFDASSSEHKMRMIELK